jgi:hypothetical protein
MRVHRIEPLSDLERVATYKAWVSQCFGDGAWLHLYRLRNGLPVSSVGGAEFQHFLTEELSVLDIERIAVCVGADSAVGLAVREMIERGEKVDARIVRKVQAFLTPLEG